jgi:heme/copper-type cytochrome/quinol oxidase subunit 1
MINRERLRSPGVLFFALAICLLPLGIVSFHSNWPSLTWKHAHFAEGDIGQTILACSGLFFAFALTYFFFPKIFHRQMNEKLGRFHFWANMIAVFLLLAFPIYFNLSFHSQPDESKLDRFLRAFGRSLDSFAWGIGALLTVQVLFLGNLLWSIFKGQKVSRPTITESTAASSEV